MSFSEVIAPLIGRLALAWYLVNTAWGYAVHWQDTMALMAARHIPGPPILFLLALLVVIMGAVALVLGFHARHGAMLLFAFMILVAVLVHNFWAVTDPDLHQTMRELFDRDVLVMAGLLFVVGLGPGRFAIDNTGQGKKKRG